MRASAGILDLLGAAREFLGFSVADRDVRSAAGESQRGRPPESSRCAGHQHDASLERESPGPKGRLAQGIGDIQRHLELEWQESTKS